MSSRKISRKLLTAAWVAPMTGAPIREAGVVFSNGRIEAVGGTTELRTIYPDAEIEEMGDAVILPGLVNAHTHLELSHISRGWRPTHLAQWIVETVLPQTSRAGMAMPEDVEAATQAGVEQCLRFGVTTVGDISKQCIFTRRVLRDGPLRVVSYGEVQAMAKRRGLLEERFAPASDISIESAWLRVGISPHAPYTVEPAGYKRCLEFAKSQNRPIATHLAETADEAEFLAEHSGPFRRLWENGVNAWDDAVPRFTGGPIRFAKEMGLLEYPTLLAHVNYCDDEELDILAAGKASVVFCPRTHEYFGHPPHRWREMLGRGINVAIGTDSCASSPDLNIVDDLRLLHRQCPNEAPLLLWQLATVRAARAVGMDYPPCPGTPGEGRDEGLPNHWNVGSLSSGGLADFVIFKSSKNEPLLEILETDALPSSAWIQGQRLYRS
jgi:cytosine/adenosine deaminase-related metal-dependent hydrolase